MTETAVRRAITSANTYQHYNRDDPLSQQRRGKLLAMFWLDGASLYLVSVYMMASRIYKFSKIQNFQPQHQPQLGASFSHGLTSVSRVQRRVVILHAKTPIGAYNDVRVEVCIIILERVFHDVLLSSISHQKHLFFQIRSRIWTCGKVLFELDMPHVKQNPSVSQSKLSLVAKGQGHFVILHIPNHIAYMPIYQQYYASNALSRTLHATITMHEQNITILKNFNCLERANETIIACISHILAKSKNII